MLGGFYTFIVSFIEVLSVLALVATLIFSRQTEPSQGASLSNARNEGLA